MVHHLKLWPAWQQIELHGKFVPLEPPRCNEQRSRRKPAQAVRRLTLKGAAYKAAGVSSASRRCDLKYVPLGLEYLLVPGGMLIAAGDHALIFPARPSGRGDHRDNAAKGGQHDKQIHPKPTFLQKSNRPTVKHNRLLVTFCLVPVPSVGRFRMLAASGEMRPYAVASGGPSRRSAGHKNTPSAWQAVGAQEVRYAFSSNLRL